MVSSLFQSLAILVVLHVYALGEPQPFVRYRYYYEVLTLPPRTEKINTVKPVTIPIQENTEGDSVNANKDSRINMNVPELEKNSPQTTPTLPSNSPSTNVTQPASKSTQSEDSNSSQAHPSDEDATSDAKDSKSKLVPASRRVKKISVTGITPSKAEEPVTRQRAMTLPR